MVQHRYRGIFREARLATLADFRGKSTLANSAKTCRISWKRLELRTTALITALVALIMVVAIPIGWSPWQISKSNAWADTPASPKGTLWVFTVGVSQFRNSMIDLQFADNDAQTLADTLAQRSASVFSNVKTQVIVNDQVTRKSIIDGMLTFFAQASPNDTGIIALMGHGVTANGTFYYVPYPADLSNLTTEGLPLDEFAQAVNQVSAKLARTVLIVDTCHAAALNFEVRDLSDLASREQKARGISMVNALAPKMPVGYILSSSEGTENSWEDASYRLPDEKKGHGAFTYALLRGLDGDAAHNGEINILDLATYASEEVPLVTGDKQHPYVNAKGTNFEIATARSISPADQQQATALTQQGVQAQHQGNLKQAQNSLARADELNPNNQVSRVLHDEVTGDIALKNDPSASGDLIKETDAMIKQSKHIGPTDEWAPRPMVIAFLDFNTMGSAPELAGLHEALVARISQSLQGAKRVKVVDRHLLDKVLQELKLSASDLSDPDTRLKVGRILTARLIGTGNVVFLGKDKYVVNLQMIDTETTEITLNLSEQGSGPDQIMQVADKVTSDIMSGLAANYPLRGKIAAIDGDLMILDIGSKAGATVGAQMKAVVEVPILVNGEVVANRTSDLGSMEITEVHEKVSFAKVIDHKGALTVGTKVIQSANPGAKAGGAAASNTSAQSSSSGG